MQNDVQGMGFHITLETALESALQSTLDSTLETTLRGLGVSTLEFLR